MSDFFWPARHRRRAAVFELGDQPLYPAAAAIGPTEHEADRAAATTCSAEKAARTRAADDASFDELNGADDARS